MTMPRLLAVATLCAVAHVAQGYQARGYQPRTALRRAVRQPLSTEVVAANPVRSPSAKMVIPADPLRREAVKRGNRYRSDDWLANVLSIPRSRVLRRISFHLVTNVLWGGLVYFLKATDRLALSMPVLPHTMLGGFLSLLLVFRTNSAYGRFWEARILWGGIMNTCRTLAQYGVVHLRPLSPALAAKFLALLAAFPHALAHRLVEGKIPLQERVQKSLPKPQWANIPSNVLLEMRQVLHDITVIAADKQELSKGLDRRLQLNEVAKRVDNLVDNLGACERILRTPLPLSYSRHTSRFLTIWCLGLPLVLEPVLGWMMIPAVAIICWALFAIEEIGHLIEMPFVPSLNPVADEGTDIADEGSKRFNPPKNPNQLYSYGVPVEVLAATICGEVEDIASTDYGTKE